jgi:TldD protein
MTNLATSSLLDRANLDRDAVRHEVARGLSGADDGELFLEYAQTEALMFDNGRLKQATYDTSQGFGLRAVKDDAVGSAHSSDVSLPALMRAADAIAAVLQLLPRIPMCGSMATTIRSRRRVLRPR